MITISAVSRIENTAVQKYSLPSIDLPGNGRIGNLIIVTEQNGFTQDDWDAAIATEGGVG